MSRPTTYPSWRYSQAEDGAIHKRIIHSAAAEEAGWEHSPAAFQKAATPAHGCQVCATLREQLAELSKARVALIAENAELQEMNVELQHQVDQVVAAAANLQHQLNQAPAAPPAEGPADETESADAPASEPKKTKSRRKE